MIRLQGRTGIYTFDPFVKSNLIGEGGMSKVYRGNRENDGKPVAVKVIVKDMASNQYVQFLTRFSTTVSIQHPNVMKMYELIVSNNIYHVICKYYEGSLLSDVIEKRAHYLSKKDKWKIIAGILNGIYAIHSNFPQIIHRDIKPSNIMISKDKNPVILDFGIAKVDMQEAYPLDNILKNRPIGTKIYSSPEQLLGKPVDNTTDLYASSVTFYSLMTNQNHDQISQLIDSNKRIILKEHRLISKDTLSVLKKSVAYNPTDRWRDARSFKNALFNVYYKNWLQKIITIKNEADRF